MVHASDTGRDTIGSCVGSIRRELVRTVRANQLVVVLFVPQPKDLTGSLPSQSNDAA